MRNELLAGALALVIAFAAGVAGVPGQVLDAAAPTLAQELRSQLD